MLVCAHFKVLLPTPQLYRAIITVVFICNDVTVQRTFPLGVTIALR